MPITRSRAVVDPGFINLTRNLGKTMARETYDKALKAGGKVIKDAAVANLKSTVPGSKARDIVTQKIQQRKLGQGELATLYIGVNPDRWHLAFVEYGRQAIEARGKAIPIHLEDGTVIFAKRAKAVRPRPFWRPARDQNLDKATRIMFKELDAGLDRHSRELTGPYTRKLGRRIR